MSDLIKNDEEKSIIANIVLKGDLSGLQPEEKVRYYNMFCDSLGLNPVTKPFDIISLSGKQVLYAKKECTEQLRKINGVSIIELKKTFDNGLYIVEAKAQDKTGKIDISTGAVSIMNLKGDSLANAIMKAETKAKRRVTLSICGLGILDETELETIPEFKDITGNVEKNQLSDVKSEIKGNEKPAFVNPANPVTNANLIKQKFGNTSITPNKDKIVNEAGKILLNLNKETLISFKDDFTFYINLKNSNIELTDEELVLQQEKLKTIESRIAEIKKQKTGAVNDADPEDVSFHLGDKKDDILPKGCL